MTVRDDEERLLSILHAHGQRFLSSFDIPAPKRDANDSHGSSSEFEEEWAGFGSSTDRGNYDAASSDEQGSGSEQENGDVVESSSRTPDTMIFLDSTWKRREAGPSTKELRRSFMSSKVSSIALSSTEPISKGKVPDVESDDERTNAQNDALLHRLVHTKLLSGSLNSELDLDHAQKGRALAGRVLELTGAAKLGKGENMFRQKQHNKAAKHIRDGLIRKQREEEKKVLEEAKDLGNYHPALRRVYESNPPAPKKKRARGLGIGIGKFVGGTLRLSRDEIASATGSRKRPHWSPP